MKKEPHVFLIHILESIDLIEKYIKNVTSAKFHKNQAVQDAVIRRLEVIGEASKNLPLSFRVKHSNIPWKKMTGMRDVLIHEYFGIDLTLTWKVAKEELSFIKKKLSEILTLENSKSL